MSIIIHLKVSFLNESMNSKKNLLLKLILIDFAFISCGYSTNDDFKPYSAIFTQPRRIIKEQKLNILNSPQKYFDITEEIHRSINLRTISKATRSVVDDNVLPFFDNVTEIPVTTWSSLTTETVRTTAGPTTPPEPQVSEICQVHVSIVLQGLTSNKIWALRSECKWFSMNISIYFDIYVV